MLQDLAPGRRSSNPIDFVVSGGNAYFGANDGTHGLELWAVPVRGIVAAAETSRRKGLR